MNGSGAGKRAKRSKSRSEDELPVLPDTKGDLFWEMNEPGAEFKQNVVGIAVVRADGSIGYINPYLASLTGESPADLVNEPLLDIIAEQDRAANAEVVKDCVSGKRRSAQLETTMTHKSGTIVDVFVDVSAAIFEGQPAAVGAVIDISSRKQAEAELRASEAKLANALKIVDAADWEYDVLADRFTFNDNFYRMYHTTAKAVGGYTMSSADYAERFVHPDDRETVGAEVKAAIETDDPNFSRTLEHHILYADGTAGWVSVRFVVIKDEAGRTIKTHGVNQDITARKQAEQALADSEAKLQTALTNMSQGLVMLDSEGGLVLFNRRFAEIFLLSQDQILPGMTLPEIIGLATSQSGVGDLDPEGTMAQVEKILRGTEAGSFVVHLSDGRSIADTYQPMPGGGMVVTFEDITDRRQAEQALADSEAKLQTALSNMSQGLLMIDTEGKLVLYNSRLEEIYGLPPEVLEKGMPVSEAMALGVAATGVQDVNPEATLAELAKVLGDPAGGTYVQRLNDGRTIAVSFEPMMPEGGVVVTFEDITARKQAEQALADSEAKLQTALTNMSQGLLMIDAEGKLVLHNSRLEEIYGLPPEVLKKGMPISEAMALEVATTSVQDVNPEATLAELAKVLGDPAGGTYVQRLNDGRTIAASFEPMPEGGVVVTFEDITVRKQAEQALADSEAKLQTALTNMSQGLLMQDAEGGIILFNRRFAEIFQLPQDQIRPGMTVPELMKLAASTSGLRDLEPEATLAQLVKVLHDPAGGTYVQRLNDGRTISESFQPMPQGGVVVTFDDITQRLADQAEIRRMAHFDALTELPNRVSFYDQLDTLMKHQRPGEFVGVLSLDLDHFKAVNDTLGHPTGDLLLQAAARRMQSCLRGEDIPARLGGDEFAIIQTPVKDPSDITALAGRLIEVISAPYELDGRQVIVGISIGVAVAPSDGTEPDVLMKNADLALYRAKADGGNVYRFFEPEMDARMQARRLIELDLRKAIHNGGEFELLYQPMVDVKTGKVTSCEALLRWSSPERGLVMPAEFIPVAEATGLIVPLGEWVLYHACVEAARWPEEISVSVNLSPAQFKSKALVQSIKNALAGSGLPPNRLEIEITEQVLMNESEGAFSILHQIRDLGIRVAMDDFGTGYSSIGYLRAFPFSKIKIDQSFIRDLPCKKDSIAIVRAVVALSSNLGIMTTAEGVETEEQYASVTTEGCNMVQGNLFSEPRPGAEVVQFFKKRFHEDT